LFDRNFLAFDKTFMLMHVIARKNVFVHVDVHDEEDSHEFLDTFLQRCFQATSFLVFLQLKIYNLTKIGLLLTSWFK